MIQNGMEMKFIYFQRIRGQIAPCCAPPFWNPDLNNMNFI